jgi:hypothetical protein
MVASAWPMVNQFTVVGLVAGTAKAAQNAWLANTKMLPGGSLPADFLATSGAVTPQVPVFRVDTTTSGTTYPAAINRISPINFVPGMIIIVGIVSGVRPHTFKNNQGGAGALLHVNGDDITLDSASGKIIYQLDSTSNNWNELLRFPGSSSNAWQQYIGLKPAAFWNEADTAGAQAGISSTTLITPRRLKDGVGSYANTYGGLTMVTAANSSDVIRVGRTGTPNSIVGITQANLMGNSPTKYWESGNVDLDSGSSPFWTHGLGGRPKQIMSSLICVSTDLNYSATNGDEIITFNSGITLWFNANSIGALLPSPLAIQAIIGNGGGSPVNITLSKWKLFIRAIR